MSLNLSRIDVINLALAVSHAATSAYVDERLNVAATDHHLAARLWAEAGYDLKAKHHSVLAEAITNEMIELAAGEDDEN